MSGATVSGVVSSKIVSYEDFVESHGVLLAASGLPHSLHRRLFHKLTSETFDGGSHFTIEPCEDGRQRRLLLTSDFMAKESDVFLVDHAWTFRLPDAYKQLCEVPGLAERMAALMCVDVDTEERTEGIEECGEKLSVEDVLESEIRSAVENGDGIVRWLELEELAIDDDKLLLLGLSSKFPDLVALSLCGNKLENPDLVIQEVTKFENIKGLWLNNNPVLEKGDIHMEKAIIRGCQKLEIYNSRFTCGFGFWALGFCADIYGKDKPLDSGAGSFPLATVTSLDLSNRGILNLLNKSFSAFEMPSLAYLNIRGNPLDEIATEELFAILSPFQFLRSLEVDIPGPLGESATEILKSLPKLSILNGIDTSKILETGKDVVDSMLQPRLPEWTPGEPLADCVLNAMWLYLMTYRLADEEKIDETSVWYVMDELGSAVRHSDQPNFKVAPFLFMPEKKLASAMSFSILWPTQDVQKGDECTRDFLYGIGEDKQRSARLTAWFHTPENYFIKEYEKHSRNLQSRKLPGLPVRPSASSLCRTDGSALCVYTDIPHVQDFLRRPEFMITAEPKDADIIWTSMQVDEEMKKAAGINDQQYVNQFPFEACLVMKHHLAETIQKAQGSPNWLQPTYNLETQLSQLIGDYCIRKQDGLNNLWILKPWNMARTIDTTITDDLCAIIRLMETGPKICQKYIERPAFFKGRKFDLRYIVLVRSMNPLEIFLADVFWVRLANNQYSLEKHSLHEYETHFTVMNYRGGVNHMHISEFVREFEQEHGVKWMDIQVRVKSLIRAVFESAAVVHPEMHNPKSRSIYGLDVMLDGSYQPKLLEVTYCPDCTRACNYDMEDILGDGKVIRGRDFFNFVFGCLFLNETKHVTQL